MKSLWTILRITSLVALIAAMAVVFLFFQTWQKNERPKVIEAKWEHPETSLGDKATLLVTLEAPWHREITTANPGSHPETFLPVKHETDYHRGSLDLSGHREWKLRIPLVATAEKLPEGLAISIPLEQSKRSSPGTVNVPLPPLTVNIPEEIPADPANSNTFLQPDALAPEEENTASFEEEKSYLWASLISSLVLIGTLIFFLLRKPTIKEKVPPWELALGRLERLDISKNPITVVARLTDILKDYTSERFAIAANTKTSSEYLRVIKTLPDLPESRLTELPWLARVSDAAKFAGRAPSSDDPPRALKIVREFVENTTPQEDPQDA
jgi:hypothetical protein